MFRYLHFAYEKTNVIHFICDSIQSSTQIYLEKTITLSNEIISEQNRMRFTLAHEIGHLELHGKVYADGISHIDEYEESRYSSIPDKILYKMEIQANMFASYLLMPEHLFLRAVLDLFKEYFITNGFLFVDNQPCN